MGKHTTNSRFKEGSGKYTCCACLKETRETGHDESEVELCAKCLLENYVENARSDHGEGSPEHMAAEAALTKASP
jgi:hypothetical protein